MNMSNPKDNGCPLSVAPYRGQRRVVRWSLYPTWSIPHIGMVVDVPHIESRAGWNGGQYAPHRWPR